MIIVPGHCCLIMYCDGEGKENDYDEVKKKIMAAVGFEPAP